MYIPLKIIRFDYKINNLFISFFESEKHYFNFCEVWI